MRFILTRTSELATACLILLGMAACGGGGGGGGSAAPTPQPPPPQPVRSVSIVPASTPVNPDEIFDVAITVSNLGAASFAAFDVSYDPAIVQFIDASEGDFFDQGATDPTRLLVAQHNGLPGLLAVGISRLSPAGDVAGTGTVLTLSFRALNSGATDIGFVTPRAFRNSVNQDVSITDWVGGTVTVL